MITNNVKTTNIKQQKLQYTTSLSAPHPRKKKEQTNKAKQTLYKQSHFSAQGVFSPKHPSDPQNQLHLPICPSCAVDDMLVRASWCHSWEVQRRSHHLHVAGNRAVVSREMLSKFEYDDGQAIISWLVVEPPHLKNMLVKLGSSSTIFGVKIKKCLKPPPRLYI